MYVSYWEVWNMKQQYFKLELHSDRYHIQHTTHDIIVFTVTVYQIFVEYK